MFGFSLNITTIRSTSSNLDWLFVAMMYASAQRSWELLTDLPVDLKMNLARNMSRSISAELAPAALDRVYTVAEDQIARITDLTVKEYALSVLPSKAQYRHRFEILLRDVTNYMEEHIDPRFRA